MTHPDIIAIEKHGYLPSVNRGVKIGNCAYCEADIYDDFEAVASKDGLFCDMDCCCEYYEIYNV